MAFAKDVKIRGGLSARRALTEKRLASSPYTVEFTVEDVAQVPDKERRFGVILRYQKTEGFLGKDQLLGAAKWPVGYFGETSQRWATEWPENLL